MSVSQSLPTPTTEHRLTSSRLQEVLDSVEAIDQSAATAGAIDETALNRLVASVAGVAKDYGIRFPREFALLVKQVRFILFSNEPSSSSY